jgi:hypothetical protein
MQLGHVVGQLVEALSYELEGRGVDSASNINEYSYNKTNELYKFLNFIFGIELYMFRTVSLSIVRSLALYTQQ